MPGHGAAGGEIRIHVGRCHRRTDHYLTGSASGKLATMTTTSSLASSASTLPPEGTITNPVAVTELSLMAHTKCSMPGSYNATRVLVSAATSSALSTVSLESTPCQAVARIIPIATIDYQTVTRSRCLTPDSAKQEVAYLPVMMAAKVFDAMTCSNEASPQSTTFGILPSR